MEKFINYDGLDLLCNKKKIKKKVEQKKPKKASINVQFISESYLDSFKEFLHTKINNFIPNKSDDKFDIILLSLWHQYIFHNVDNNKYYKVVNNLNEKILNPELINKNTQTDN